MLLHFQHACEMLLKAALVQQRVNIFDGSGRSFSLEKCANLAKVGREEERTGVVVPFGEREAAEAFGRAARGPSAESRIAIRHRPGAPLREAIAKASSPRASNCVDKKISQSVIWITHRGCSEGYVGDGGDPFERRGTLISGHTI